MRALRGRSDRQLLRATRAGDAEAFGEFFVRHADAVLGYVRSRIGGAETAADLTAETFAAALEAVQGGRAEDVRNGAAWLTGIAAHKLVDTYRRARVAVRARLELELPALVVDDHDAALIDRLAARQHGVVAALDRLSPDERAAIVARIVHERDYDRIARDLGQSPTTVRKRVSRGLTRLRKETGAHNCDERASEVL